MVFFMIKNFEKNKLKMNKPFIGKGLSLVRYGGLNLVKQKGNYGNDTYHSAPEKYGFYAFIYPYIELFLIGSTKVNEFKASVRKEFNAVDGLIWSHIKPVNSSDIIQVHNSWYKTTVEVLKKSIAKEYAESSSLLQAYNFFQDIDKRIPFNPNKSPDELKIQRINPYSWCSTDYLEVFICKDTKIS